jgi:uncharacterized protein YceK
MHSANFRAQIIAIVITSALITGCATVNSTYTAPSQYTEANRSIIIDKGKDDVWIAMVRALGENFFIINNLDKESGLINVSYNANPEKYCDCGTFHAEYHFTQNEIFDFPAAIKFQEYKSKLPNGQHTIISRNMSLDGRINILIIDDKDAIPKRCRISVNARYIVTESVNTRIINGVPHSNITNSVSFDSGNMGALPTGTICYPNGKLEAEILEMIKASL